MESCRVPILPLLASGDSASELNMDSPSRWRMPSRAECERVCDKDTAHLVAGVLEEFMQDSFRPSAGAPQLRPAPGARRDARASSSAEACCSPLCSPSIPQIGLKAYARRLLKYGRCSPLCLLWAQAYILRLRSARPAGLEPGPRSMHRLLLAGLVLAAKATEDRCCTNRHYARIGGVELAELNAMELALLKLLDYRVLVGATELSQAAEACAAAEEESPSPGPWRRRACAPTAPERRAAPRAEEIAGATPATRARPSSESGRRCTSTLEAGRPRFAAPQVVA
ncbi:hypothetical protein H632_c2054p0 [Helicosporidium sp. ATCC 50920]|nr:hypothetical protein H632_c2054p0 [Helicosporidium sp. ATCC 50920]|eukprot:KDD73560.1 hypothetical protein H632_c2054p0 [Helicosporidium sp. ATCC 50920]